MKRALPWIIGFVGFVVWFTYFETKAFIDPDNYMTLSHFVSSIDAKWPLFGVLVGNVIGILEAHFFWPWKQNPLGDGGG